jgi:aspartyl-tRNA synthetase
MLVAGEQSIREVIAFPKNNKACDLMTDSPTTVDFRQLRELYVQSTYKEKRREEAASAETAVNPPADS